MTTATHSDTTQALDYRFGTGAPTGVWLGLGVGRIAILASSLLLTVALLGMRAGLPVGLCPLAVGAGLTLIPIAGRPLAAWITPATTHSQANAAGSNRWAAAMPHTPLTPHASPPSAPGRLRLPPECGRVRMIEAADPTGACSVAALRHGARAPVTLLFAVAGPDRFGLLDPDGQDRLVAGWGRALISFAQRDRRAARVQLIERVSIAESDTAAATSWAASRTDGSNALAGLTDMVEQATVRRDSLIAVQAAVDPAEIVGTAREIAGQLLAAELLARPLSAAEVTDLLRRMLNPGDESTGPDAGPVSRRTRWDHVRVDDSWHRSFAVSSWPGSPVPASWLSSLLVAAPAAGAWTTAVHLVAVPPELASRMARAARTKADLDRADRARLGLSASAAADKAVSESAGMDAELVAGHAAHRLAAVLTCTAGSLEELRASERRLRDAAAGGGLSIRPLHGQQHLALAATLPLCRLRFGGVA